MRWSDLIPDDAEFMILTDQPSPWVMLMCVPCNKVLLAATHLEPWDWLRKAQDHYEKEHAGLPPLTEEAALRAIVGSKLFRERHGKDHA